MQVQEESHSSRSHPTRRPATTRPTSQPSHAQRRTSSQAIAQHSPPDQPTGATPQSPPPNSVPPVKHQHLEKVPPPNLASTETAFKWCHPLIRRLVQMGATPQSGPNRCHPPNRRLVQIGATPNSNPAGRLVPPLSQPPDHPRPVRYHPSNVGISKRCHPPIRRPIQMGATLRIGAFRCSVPPFNSESPGDGCRAPIPGPCHLGDSLPNSRRRNSCLGADPVSACRISALIASSSAPNAMNPEYRNRH